jgi:hypothetical protein
VKWESWALRLLLLAAFGYQLVTGNWAGATVAAEGVVASLMPVAVARASHIRVPRVVEFTGVLAVALQFISESFKLFELLSYWDKLVHPTLRSIGCAATSGTRCRSTSKAARWTLDASIDGKPLYALPGLPDASGEIGVFGLTASATCFSQAAAQVGTTG